MKELPVLAAFAASFRTELAQAVEYSVSSRRDQLGTMIGGDAMLLRKMRRFAQVGGVLNDWLNAIDRFAEVTVPTAYLLKIDWVGSVATGLSVYLGFLDNFSNVQLRDAFISAGYEQWQESLPHDIAFALDKASPSGIGLRTTVDGRSHSAMYYDVSLTVSELRARALPRVIERCGWSAESLKLILADLHKLYVPGPVGVVGVDRGPNGGVARLKLDPSDVSIPRALAFLAQKRVPRVRLDEIAGLARSLRVSGASTLGTKYGPHGFEGWKLYWSVQPQRVSARALSLVVVHKAQPPCARN